MKSRRECSRIARNLFRLASPKGTLDQATVLQIADAIASGQISGGLPVLKEFYRLIRLELARHHATVSTPTPLDEPTTQSICQAIHQRFGAHTTITFTTRPELIGGARIQVGSDVWDSSIKARLEALKN